MTKVWPDSGTAADPVESHPEDTNEEDRNESELIDIDVSINVPPKYRESDPEEIKDTFYIFISTSVDAQILS